MARLIKLLKEKFDCMEIVLKQMTEAEGMREINTILNSANI